MNPDWESRFGFFDKLHEQEKLREQRREKWSQIFHPDQLCVLCKEPSIESLESAPEHQPDCARIRALGNRVFPCPHEKGGCGTWWHNTCLMRWLSYEDWCPNPRCQATLDETVLQGPIRY